VGAKVKAKWKGKWLDCVVEKVGKVVGKEYYVRRTEDNILTWLSARRLRGRSKWKVGDFAECSYNGVSYPCEIMKENTNDGTFKIHWTDDGKVSNSVNSNKIRTAQWKVGAKVKAKWKGKWLDCVVEKVGKVVGKEYYVRRTEDNILTWLSARRLRGPVRREGGEKQSASKLATGRKIAAVPKGKANAQKSDTAKGEPGSSVSKKRVVQSNNTPDPVTGPVPGTGRSIVKDEDVCYEYWLNSGVEWTFGSKPANFREGDYLSVTFCYNKDGHRRPYHQLEAKDGKTHKYTTKWDWDEWRRVELTHDEMWIEIVCKSNNHKIVNNYKFPLSIRTANGAKWGDVHPAEDNTAEIFGNSESNPKLERLDKDYHIINEQISFKISRKLKN